MAERLKIYKCEDCGDMIEVFKEGCGDYSCHGKPMKLLEENTTDAAKEKHVPVIEKTAAGFVVKIGSVAHPMEEKHYIEWIEVSDDEGRVYRKHLKPGDAPEAEFNMPPSPSSPSSKIVAREHCNIHGLWKGE